MTPRQEHTKELMSFVDDMDPTGKNSERLIKFLSQMTDKEYYSYFIEFYDNIDKNFTIAYEPFNNPVNMDFINKICKKHNISLYEYIYMPYTNGNIEDPPGSAYKIMVLDFPVKRLKQMVFTKNHASTSTTKKDPKTGQVTGVDKTARVTDVEAFSLIVQEQYHALQEYYGPMSDDTKADFEMQKLIQRDGEVEFKDLPNDPINKVTLNTINYYLLGACISTNLIDQSGYLLPITLKAREDKVSVIDK